jgi:osmotically inducible protein OsmC
MQRKASAVWQGGLKDGKGSSQPTAEFSRRRNTPSALAENGVGTNPEELLAAAHAVASPWRCRLSSAMPA